MQRFLSSCNYGLAAQVGLALNSVLGIWYLVFGFVSKIRAFQDRQSGCALAAKY